MYNVYNLEPKFKEFLFAENISPVSIRNYLSDVRHFFGWFFSQAKVALDRSLSEELKSVTQDDLQRYKEQSAAGGLPISTINRRLSALRKFFSFCLLSRLIELNPSENTKNFSTVISRIKGR